MNIASLNWRSSRNRLMLPICNRAPGSRTPWPVPHPVHMDEFFFTGWRDILWGASHAGVCQGHPRPRTGGYWTYVILMNADCVLASGSLKSIAAPIAEGYTVITSQSIRVLDGRARTQLLESMDRNSGIRSIEPRGLMRIVNRHLHSTVTARILNEPTIVDSTHYHQIFWRISHECLAMQAFMLHPLCFRVDRIMQKVFCPVDYGFITEIFPNGRFCVIGDSDDCLIMELQARDAESHLLRIAPKRKSLRQRLSRLRREIAAVAACCPFPLGPRGAGLSGEAVRAYRDNMIRGGSDARVELLDDPRNLSAAR